MDWWWRQKPCLALYLSVVTTAVNSLYPVRCFLESSPSSHILVSPLALRVKHPSMCWWDQAEFTGCHVWGSELHSRLVTNKGCDWRVTHLPHRGVVTKNSPPESINGIGGGPTFRRTFTEETTCRSSLWTKKLLQVLKPQRNHCGGLNLSFQERQTRQDEVLSVSRLPGDADPELLPRLRRPIQLQVLNLSQVSPQRALPQWCRFPGLCETRGAGENRTFHPSQTSQPGHHLPLRWGKRSLSGCLAHQPTSVAVVK